MPDPTVDLHAPNPATNDADSSRRGLSHPAGEVRSQGGRGGNEEGSGAHQKDASRPRRPRNRRPKEGTTGEPFNTHPSGSISSAGPSGKNVRDRRIGSKGQVLGSSGDSHSRRRRENHNANPDTAQLSGASASVYPVTNAHKTASEDVSAFSAPFKRSRARRNFNSKLTAGVPQSGLTDQNISSADKYRKPVSKADDLTSRLIAELSTPPYLDCLICFAPITPMQSTWSCSPSQPTLPATDGEGGVLQGQAADANAQCCWITFHLKCIRPWAAKNVKDVEQAWQARGEVRQGDWRCPGCQSKRTAIPSSYWCFCGSIPDPKPPRLATPHSCANSCSRPKDCGHPCPLNCHPGPCPPCQVTTSLPCYCGKEVISFRCSHRGLGAHGALKNAELSCGNDCGRMLSCGNHNCQEPCHPGRCRSCIVRDKARCYCGKEERELGCGEGEEKESLSLLNGKVERWTGRYTCEQTCQRPFDCGMHHCQKPCHPPSPTAAPCPRSPEVVTYCPCGKHSLSPESAPFFPSGTLLTRLSCADPIPTCESICMKPLDGCGHVCSSKCHIGPCPPCTIVLVRPCRCGSTTSDVRCSEDQARARARARGEIGPETEILCERPCGMLRACGRHQCTRVCCPLASLVAPTKGKGKKRAEMASLVDQNGWHECDLVCDKVLSCGNHHCEERDHKGACPPCLRSSFQEMVCNCGRTVLEPPIPCGTRIACSHPCSRPLPPCGHPMTRHACHEDSNPCPPCPYLTSKKCACGKKMVDNVRCSQEKVSCGMTCGKLLSCGFHHCDRSCHGDACGACHATCGKPRKLCLPAQHSCTLLCHAPASCDESEPCRSIVTITCPCGRIRQSVPCGRSLANPARDSSLQLKCSSECAIAKRNARLAEALGIDSGRGDSRTQQVIYKDELLAFARANTKFCTLVEKTFSDFLSSDQKSQILPHMAEQKRTFVHDLAGVYRMDTRMLDQEPHRSIQLLRRIGSRIPAPLLSAGSTPSSPGLGKLADLRVSGSGLQPLSRPGSAPGARASPAPMSQPVAGSSTGRGWTSVVARPTQPSTQSTWGPPTERAKTPLRSAPSPPPHYTIAAPPPVAQPGDPQDVPEDWEDAA